MRVCFVMVALTFAFDLKQPMDASPLSCGSTAAPAQCLTSEKDADPDLWQSESDIPFFQKLIISQSRSALSFIVR